MNLKSSQVTKSIREINEVSDSIEIVATSADQPSDRTVWRKINTNLIDIH